MELKPGDKLGPYEIISAIGRGGMGEVWKARDPRLGRDVAIKISARRFDRRFEREARAIAALNHPNICQIYDIGPDYIVMEFIDGAPPRGPLAATEVVRLALGVAAALETAHSQGITHRDLKPANVLVTHSRVKLLDFGLALVHDDTMVDTADTSTALSMPGTVMGTPAYMSPEQAQGRPADARSDIFSFGVMLYELVSGRLPFAGNSPGETMVAIMRDEPAPLDAPARLAQIVTRCLRKAPASRFQTMAEVRAALEQITAVPANTPPSIAVLPFADMSVGKDHEYFSDGLAEEIINALVKVPDLKVIARTSAFAFKGQNTDIRKVAETLGVANVLEGSVRRSGNRIRVTAQLITAADGSHLWSERYDRELAEVFAVQDEISAAIVGALRIRLSPESAPPRRHVPDLRAYEAFLKGRECLLSRPSPGSIARGRELLENAIKLDPKFALPHSLLGAHYTGQAYVRPAREFIPLARAAQQEALRVDPALPEAHAMLGVCAGMEYRWSEAEAHWAAAMASEPIPRDVLFWYGNHYLLPSGCALDAVGVESKVLDDDPLNLLYRRLYAIALQHAGRLEDAEGELRKVLEIDETSPALGTLGLVGFQQGRLGEALAVTERAYKLVPLAPIAGQLAALLVRAGAGSRAGAMIEKLRSGQTYGASTGLALFHALCGEFDQASHWAERAIEERNPYVVAILGPFLRPSPQWPALEKLMSLPRVRGGH